MKKQLCLIGLAILLASALLGACTGAPKPVDITVTTTDFSFAPTSYELQRNQPVNLTLVNSGALEHEFVILKAGQTVSAPFDADDEDKVFWEVEAEPGETTTATFTAPSAAGTYEVICGVAGHFEVGMKATLVVK